MTFFIKINDLLFHPDAFFAQLENDEVNLVPPVAIALFPGIGFIVAFMVQMTLTGTAAGQSENEILTRLLTSSPLMMIFLFPLLMWVIASVVIWLVSGKLSGTGSLKATLQNTGYGLFPSGIYSIISQVLSIGIISISAETQSFGVTVVPLMILSLSSLVFTFWTWYVWVCGTMHAQRITMGNAVIAVVVVIVVQWILAILLYVLPFVWGMLGQQLFM
jgi:hypothetical protein